MVLTTFVSETVTTSQGGKSDTFYNNGLFGLFSSCACSLFARLVGVGR